MLHRPRGMRVVPSLLLIALSVSQLSCGGGGGGGGDGGGFELAAIDAADVVLAAGGGAPAVVKLTFTITGTPNTQAQFLVQYALQASPDFTPGAVTATEAPADVVAALGDSDANPGTTETIGPNGTVDCVFFWWFGADFGFACPGDDVLLDITPYDNGNPAAPNGENDTTLVTEAQLACVAPNPPFPVSGDPIGAGNGRAGMTGHLVSPPPPGSGLSDADVVIIGGYNGSAPYPFETADLFEFDFGAVTHSNNISLSSVARRFHASEFFIAGDGSIKILVTGGDTDVVNPVPGAGAVTDEAEIYCFTASAPFFRVVAGGMLVARKFHAACWLADNRILVTGGTAGLAPDSAPADPAAETAEIFDPASESFSAVGNLNFPRFRHTATLLPDGRVLIAGGYDPLAATPAPLPAEIYDPLTMTFTPVAGSSVDRINHTATRLLDGNIILVGGRSIATSSVLDTASLFDCGVQSFTGTVVVPSLGTAREFHTATRIGTGQVLVAGGFGSAASALSSAEVLSFTPTLGFNAVSPLGTGRAEHVAVPTNPGPVVLMGGKSGSAASPLFLDSVEFYPLTNTPPDVQFFTPTYASTSAIPISFTLADAQGDAAFVVVQWSANFGATWNIATLADPCNSTTDLGPGTHIVTWNAAADGATGTVVVRILPFGAVLGSSAVRQLVLP